jgi:hypothetical protein
LQLPQVPILRRRLEDFLFLRDAVLFDFLAFFLAIFPSRVKKLEVYPLHIVSRIFSQEQLKNFLNFLILCKKRIATLY